MTANGEPLLPPCWDALPRCETEAEAADHGAAPVMRAPVANRRSGRAVAHLHEQPSVSSMRSP